MFRIAARSIVALGVAFGVALGAVPAAAGEIALPDGIDLVMASHCCCPSDEQRDPEDRTRPPEIDSRCCCEFQDPPPTLLQGNPAIASASDLVIPAPAALALAARPAHRIAGRLPRRATNARAPPTAGPLLAQHIALLL